MEVDRKLIVSMRKLGMTFAQIGLKVKLTKSSVRHHYLAETDPLYRRPRKRYESNVYDKNKGQGKPRKTRLQTEKQKKRNEIVLTLRDQGISFDEIAKKIGCSKTYVMELYEKLIDRIQNKKDETIKRPPSEYFKIDGTPIARPEYLQKQYI